MTSYSKLYFGDFYHRIDYLMNSFDIVSLDLFSTLVYVDRKTFDSYQALKSALLQSDEFNLQSGLLDEIIEAYYLQVRSEMSDYNKEEEFRNEDLLKNVCEEKKIGITSNIEKIVAKTIAFYFDEAVSLIHPYPGVHEILTYLLEKKYQLVLTSNHSYPKNGWDVLKKYDLTKYFNRIVFSGDIGWKKPSKKIFTYAFKDMNYSNKDRIIHIGDNLEADIRGALDYGIKAIWIFSTYKKNEIEEPTGIHGKITHIKDITQFL